jgi:hypothetical protein
VSWLGGFEARQPIEPDPVAHSVGGLKRQPFRAVARGDIHGLRDFLPDLIPGAITQSQAGALETGEFQTLAVNAGNRSMQEIGR